MDIKRKLSKRIDKEELLEMVDYIINKPKAVHDLMECFFDNESKRDQYAAWVLPYVGKLNENLLSPYYEKMLDYIDGPVHTGVQRNTMRLFEEVEIPETIEGRLYDKCIEYILNPKLPTAIPAFSITVGLKIVKKYPELKDEYLELVKPLYEYGGPAIKVRVRRVVKALEGKKLTG